MYSVSSVPHINKFMQILCFIIYHNSRMNPFMPTKDLKKISKKFCLTFAVALKGRSQHNVHNYFPSLVVRDLVVGLSFTFATWFSSLIFSCAILLVFILREICILRWQLFSAVQLGYCRGQAGASLGVQAEWAVSTAVPLSRQPFKTQVVCLFALCMMKADSDKNLGVSRCILHVHTDEWGRWKRRKEPRGGKVKSGWNKVMFCTATPLNKSCLAFRSSSILSLFRETLLGIAGKFPALLKIRNVNKILSNLE